MATCAKTDLLFLMTSRAAPGTDWLGWDALAIATDRRQLDSPTVPGLLLQMFV